VVKICAERDKVSGGPAGASQLPVDSLAVEGANVLQLLAASTVPGVEAVLWPHLLEFLLQPEFTAAVAPLAKALGALALRRAAVGQSEGAVGTEEEGLAVSYQNLQVEYISRTKGAGKNYGYAKQLYNC
jgi:hypothetical protein